MRRLAGYALAGWVGLAVGWAVPLRKAAPEASPPPVPTELRVTRTGSPPVGLVVVETVGRRPGDAVRHLRDAEPGPRWEIRAEGWPALIAAESPRGQE